MPSKTTVEVRCLYCDTAFRKLVVEVRRNPKHFCNKKCIGLNRTKQSIFDFSKKYRVSATGCWIWTGAKNQDGYGATSLRGVHMAAHRASFLLYRGPIRDGLQVRHSCDTPACVNPNHLELGTHIDNMQDMTDRGRRVRKLSVADTILVSRSNEPNAVLAAQYGVAERTIRHWKAKLPSPPEGQGS